MFQTDARREMIFAANWSKQRRKAARFASFGIVEVGSPGATLLLPMLISPIYRYESKTGGVGLVITLEAR